MSLKEFHRGHITKVSVFTHPYGSTTLYVAWIFVNLKMGKNVFQEYIKLIPCAQCLIPEILKLCITNMGFKISDDKSLQDNLVGLPVWASIDKKMNGVIEELYPLNRFKIEKVKHGKRK